MNQRKALYKTQPLIRRVVDEIPHIEVNIGFCSDGLYMETNEKRDIEIIIVDDPSDNKNGRRNPYSIWLILLQLAYRNPELTIIQKADDRFTLAKPTEYIGGIDPYKAQAEMYKDILITGRASMRIPAVNEISFFDLFIYCKKRLEK